MHRLIDSYAQGPGRHLDGVSLSFGLGGALGKDRAEGGQSWLWRYHGTDCAGHASLV